METVLTAIVVIIIVIFAIMTLTGALLTTQDALQVSWQEMNTRYDEQLKTHLLGVSAEPVSGSDVIALTYENAGSTRLINFDEWDVIVQYFDSSDPAGYHIEWLPYTKAIAANNEWTVEGIYMDAAADKAEVYEPTVFNPGEEMVIHVQLTPPLGQGETMLVTLATLSGSSSPLMFTRNIPPELTVNSPLQLTSHTVAAIDDMLLVTEDADGTPELLVYSVVTQPQQGTLNLGASFTQADIDAGLLNYEHTGLGDDTFTFTVSDGTDSIGEYTFAITATNAPPQMVVNTGLTLPVGTTQTITSAMLMADDVDNTADELIYTVTVSPMHGTINLGTLFTQSDIDNGLLTYTHQVMGDDSFTFTVSDGEATIGSYSFVIDAQ